MDGPTPRTPETIPFLTYLWVLLFAAWGGLVSYRARIIANSPHTWSVFELIGEMTVSGFAGVLVFFACEASGISPLWTAVFVGIAGHMGGRSVDLLQTYLMKRLGVS